MDAPAGHTPPHTPLLRTQDLDSLRLLSIFHYVVAGITALFSLFPIIHLTIGLSMINSPPMDTMSSDMPAVMEPSVFGWIFVVVASAMIIGGLLTAAFMVYAGRCLTRRRRYLLCLIVAGVSCAFMPFGTILGIFTLIVLMRPGVKQAFVTPSAAS